MPCTLHPKLGEIKNTFILKDHIKEHSSQEFEEALFDLILSQVISPQYGNLNTVTTK